MSGPSGAIGQAIAFVNTGMSKLDSAVAQHTSSLQGALTSLSRIQVPDVAQPKIMETPDAPEPVFRLDAEPVLGMAGLTMPEEPRAPNIDALLAQLDIGDMDALPSAPQMPALNLPAAPSMAAVPLPQRPVIDGEIELAEAPAITMPEMEALETLTIPEFEFPQLPDFDAQPPDPSRITVPSVFINWSEPRYESELLDELQGRVREMMAGGTGLPAPVEDALFSRARERDNAETGRAVQEAVDTWAARGFSMPPGMLAKQVNVIREQGRLKAAELNREVMVQAAQWEIENIRFAVQQGLALEQITANIFENAAKRLFEVARFQAEAQINVFNAQIGLFNAQNSAFGTLAQVYRTRLDGALAKLQAYKAAIDAQVATGQINQQRVEVFKARLAGVQASVEVFTAMMRGAQVRADVVKSRFDAYRADVQAYAEQIGAEKAKLDAYESQVKGEATKASMLDSQARAYAATIQGLANRADIRAKGAQLRLEAARVHLQRYLGDVEGFKAKLSASLGEVQAVTQAYQARVEGWRAKATASVAASEVQSRFADMQTRTNIAFSEMQIAQYQANIQKAVQQAQIALEAAKAIGQYSAQLAAGALSAMHVSASVNGTGSQNDSWTFAESESTSTSHNYNYNG